jgi:hypothetical protein
MAKRYFPVTKPTRDDDLVIVGKDVEHVVAPINFDWLLHAMYHPRRDTVTVTR